MDLNKEANNYIKFVEAMEAIPKMIEFLKNMYDEAIKQGFDEDQAMEIVSNFQKLSLNQN
jgi:hypothetical protein